MLDVPAIAAKIRTPVSMKHIVKNPYACDLIMQYLNDGIFYNDFVFIMRVLSAFHGKRNEQNEHVVVVVEEIENRINLNNDFLDINSPLKLSLVAEDLEGLQTFINMFQGKQTLHLITGMYNLISHRFQRDVLPKFFHEQKLEYFKTMSKFCRINIRNYLRKVRKTEKLCAEYRSAARKTLKRSKIPIHLTKYTKKNYNGNGSGGSSNSSINYNNFDYINSLSRSSTPSSTKSTTQAKSFLSPTKSSKNMRISRKKNQFQSMPSTFTNINNNNSNNIRLQRLEKHWNSSLK